MGLSDLKCTAFPMRGMFEVVGDFIADFSIERELNVNVCNFLRGGIES
jgi:hypothetical protein